jgi:rhamnulokinase
MAHNYLAFDLGAESGRTILGQLRSGVLNITEITRFPNQPVRCHGSLHWDVLRLWHEMQRGLSEAPVTKLDSVAVDTWGVDYALLGEAGELIANPYHYRDHRTDGVMDVVCERLTREKIYSVTGIQFLPFNTLYQLYAASRATPNLLAAASQLVTVPDLFNYWLSGSLGVEYTNATTTQFVDSHTRGWATGLLEELEIPTRLLPQIFEPGSVIGQIKPQASQAFAGTPVVAPACHDTGSAVAAIETAGRAAFLSSGTWSLLGAEVEKPIVTERARELNFTNEGGVCGTIRLLKNIGGLWLLQSCRRAWAAAGREYSYEDLLAAAGEQANSFESLVDPDDPSFLSPENMLDAIAAYCKRTGQPGPETPPEYTRCILESLAFKYRQVLESLESLTGKRFSEIRIIGGGAKNRLLNQFTANAAGRRVIAGPVEATALGNIAMQMLATGAVASLKEGRAIIERSFPSDCYEPRDSERWERGYEKHENLSTQRRGGTEISAERTV